MLVSIITPSFNQGRFLEETILSVLNQDYSNIEYILIDGGSSDNSKEIIMKYADWISYWVSEPDIGQADAINKGFRKSKGDLICWINSDDLLYPNFVSTRVKQFLDNPDVDFIYGDVEQGKDQSQRILRKGSKSDYKKMLLTLQIPIPQQSAIWRREVIKKIGYLDTQWYVLLDWEYFMRISQKCRILYQPGPVAFFRNHEKSKSVLESNKWAEELEKYYNNLFTGFLSDEYMSLKTKALSEMYFICAKICEATSDKESKLKYYSLAKTTNGYFYRKNLVLDFLRKKRHKLAQLFNS